MKSVQTDRLRLKRWAEYTVSDQVLTEWVDEDLSEAWGKKAACRVLHIWGAPAKADTLYDISQAMA
jgi:hypothetical protein